MAICIIFLYDEVKICNNKQLCIEENFIILAHSHRTQIAIPNNYLVDLSIRARHAD